MVKKIYFLLVVFILFLSMGFINASIFDDMYNHFIGTSDADIIGPLVNLVSPTNNSYTNSNFTVCTIEDNVAISNLTIKVWNSTGNLIYSNITVLSGVNNSSSWYVNVSSGQNYTWNCLGNDSSGNSAWATANYTFFYVYDVSNPSLVLNFPVSYNTTSPIILLNLTTNDTNFLSVNITANGVNLNSSSVPLKGQNLTIVAPSNNSFNISVTSYDNAGNINISSIIVIVDSIAPTINVYSLQNETNSRYYANNSIFLSFSVEDYLALPSSTWINFNGTTNVTLYCSNCLYAFNYYYNSSLINYSSIGLKNITFYANDSLNNLATLMITINVTNLNSTTNFIVNDTTYIINTSVSNVTNVVIPYNSTINNISLTNSSQIVTIDLTQLTNSSNIANISSNISLFTFGSNYNYSAVIPAGTYVTGNGSWDGKINMPVINTTTFTQPSINGYNTSSPTIVIDMGSDIELNFSNPVKVVIGGMAGKRAAWARGSTTLINIETQCDTNHSNINTTTRECYIDDLNGLDLNIWTYHFTTFAAYTATASSVANNQVSSGGGSIGTVETTYWGLTYVALDSEFKSLFGYTRDYSSKERTKLIIDNNIHYVGVVNLSSSFVTINVSSTPQQAVFNIGDEKKFDVNNDSYYEVYVKLNNISIKNGVNKASITVKNIYEKMPVTIITKENKSEDALTSDNSDISSSGKSWLIWLIIIIVIVIIIVVILFLKKKFKKSNNRYVVYRRGR